MMRIVVISKGNVLIFDLIRDLILRILHLRWDFPLRVRDKICFSLKIIFSVVETVK